MKIPAGYTIEWGGQFENQQRANKRLAFVLPVSIVIIFSLLYATFQSSRQALMILMIVPFALVGGVAALWIRGLNLSLSASIGFIALFGVAVLNGVVMVSHIDSLRAGGGKNMDAVREGAQGPASTRADDGLGGEPGIHSNGGLDIARSRGAAATCDGGDRRLITATMLTLYMLPMLYPWFTAASKENSSEGDGVAGMRLSVEIHTSS